jgi:hypothetical protein
MFSRPIVAAIFATTMALAGFLLFQVQPVLAKFILPWFGGSATTWIVCMLFFQVALLAGYAHAYAVTLPFRVPAQAKVQLVILALSLILLPITPSDVWKPSDASDPTWRIVMLLAACVGIPYVVLATTSPLLSRWLARIDPGLHPARFFAASNLGSFVGLLSYPFIFERYLSSQQQTLLWSWAYGLYAILFGICALIAIRQKSTEAPATAVPAGGRVEGDRLALWIFYSLLGSILLLATTNAITQWSAVIPFLWIAPLSLYLLTFVIAFGQQRFYHRTIFTVVFLFLAAAAIWSPAPDSGQEMTLQLILQCTTMFFGCMICHAEMVRLQPEPARLPKFYLAISFGGALGGVFVALVAPVILNDYFEHPLTLVIIGIVGVVLVLRDQAVSQALRPAAAAIAAVALVGAASGAVYKELEPEYDLIERVRNFYGVVKIVQEDEDDPEDHQILMTQAGVEQGSQWQNPAEKLNPLCAFDEDSGAGLAFMNHIKRRGGNPEAPLRIGIIGLGAGMLAAMGKDGDVIRYYEINPAVDALTKRYFTFLRDGKAKSDVLLGDGRLVLERQLAAKDPQQFDVLVIDAFRGASPPTHLMTREAFEIYLAHLAPNGVIAINFEINTFEMAPLHRGMAKLFGLDVRWIETQSVNKDGCEEPISWALYTKDTGLFDVERVRKAISEWRDKDTASGIVWTDASSNLMSILNWSTK